MMTHDCDARIRGCTHRPPRHTAILPIRPSLHTAVPSLPHASRTPSHASRTPSHASRTPSQIHIALDGYELHLLQPTWPADPSWWIASGACACASSACASSACASSASMGGGGVSGRAAAAPPDFGWISLLLSRGETCTCACTCTCTCTCTCACTCTCTPHPSLPPIPRTPTHRSVSPVPE